MEFSWSFACLKRGLKSPTNAKCKAWKVSANTRQIWFKWDFFLNPTIQCCLQLCSNWSPLLTQLTGAAPFIQYIVQRHLFATNRAWLKWSYCISLHADEPMRFLLCTGTAVFYGFCRLHHVKAPHLQWRDLVARWLLDKGTSRTVKNHRCVWGVYTGVHKDSYAFWNTTRRCFREFGWTRP